MALPTQPNGTTDVNITLPQQTAATQKTVNQATGVAESETVVIINTK